MEEYFKSVLAEIKHLKGKVGGLETLENAPLYGTALQRGALGNLYQGRQFLNVATGQLEDYETGYSALPPLWYKANVGASDDFTRADNASYAGKLLSGMAWVPQPNGGGMATAGITSDRFYFPSDTDGDVSLVETYTTEHVFQGILRGQIASGPNYRAPFWIFRALDKDNFLSVHLFAGFVVLSKRDGAAFTQLATTATTTTDATDYTVTILCDGLAISVFVGGVRLIENYVLGSGTATDVKYAGYSKVGQYLSKGGAPAGGATNCQWGALKLRQPSNAEGLYYDLFHRADTANVAPFDPGQADYPIGASWLLGSVLYPAFGALNWKILTNQAAYTDPNPAAEGIIQLSSSANAIIEATLTGQNTALSFRQTTVAAYYSGWFMGQDSTGQIINLASYDNATFTYKQWFAVPHVGASNDRFKVVIKDDSIICFLNESLLFSLSGTDASFNQTATRHGLYASAYNASCSFFRITPI